MRGILANRGFTFIELIFAIAIFAFAMAGILLLFINCAFLDTANREKAIAISHAETAMEYIKYEATKNFNNKAIELCSGGSGIYLLPVDLGLDNSLTEEVISVVPTLNSCNAVPLNLLDVTLEVVWRDGRQRDRSVSLKTLISKPK
jgi:prepilin-type N-terminal cleavage/methylation domain-containing protein